MKNWLVAFDLDDTLFPELSFVRSGFQAVARYLEEKLGLKGFFEKCWEKFEKGERKTIFNQVLAESGIEPSPELISELVKIYRTHPPKIVFYPEAEQILNQLTKTAHLALITDGPKEMQRNKAQALGLQKWFEEMIFTDEWGENFAKPSPAPFLELEKKFKLKQEKCFYIADNPKKDFLAPNQLGWNTIQIFHPNQLYAHQEFPREHQAKFQVKGFSELRSLLEKLLV